MSNSSEYTLTDTINSSDTNDSESSSKITSESSECLTELESLIKILKKGIKKGEPGIKVIKYPSC